MFRDGDGENSKPIKNIKYNIYCFRYSVKNLLSLLNSLYIRFVAYLFRLLNLF
jgi:hypothetical protein